MTKYRIEDALARALHRLSFPVLLLAEDGRTLFANSAAQTLLEEDCKLRAASTLEARVGLDDAQGAESAGCPLVRTATITTGSSHCVTVLRHGTTAPYTLHSDARGNRARSAPGHEVDDSETARHLDSANSRPRFGLTPAEWNIACRLADGLTAREVAHEAGVSLNTVRTHLKKIFQKLGVRRQAELVRHMTIASAVRAR